MKAWSNIVMMCLVWPVAALAETDETNWTEEAERCYATSDDPKLAIEACTEAIEKGGLSDENLAITYSNRAISHQDLGSYDAALSDIDAAIALMPDDPGHLSNRSTVYIDLHRYEDALADLDRALMLDSYDAFALNNRCWVKALMAAYDAALSDCDAALDVNEYDAYALASRSYVLTKLGRLDEALTDGEASVRLAPDIWESHFYRGLVHEARGDTKAAEGDFKRAYDIAPGVSRVQDKMRALGLK